MRAMRVVPILFSVLLLAASVTGCKTPSENSRGHRDSMNYNEGPFWERNSQRDR